MKLSMTFLISIIRISKCLPVKTQKFLTLLKVEDAPAPNANMSVRLVIVIATPLFLIICPIRDLVSLSYNASAIPDRRMNISSTPIPKIYKDKQWNHYANRPVQYTANFNGCKNDNFQFKSTKISKIYKDKRWTHYANMSVQYTANFNGFKNDNFQSKFSDLFFTFAKNIDCGYMLEPPHRGGSNKCPQFIF